jgi:hypothetical protein
MSSAEEKKVHSACGGGKKELERDRSVSLSTLGFKKILKEINI